MSDCKHKRFMMAVPATRVLWKETSTTVVYCDSCRKRAPAKITVDWGKAK